MPRPSTPRPAAIRRAAIHNPPAHFLEEARGLRAAKLPTRGHSRASRIPESEPRPPTAPQTHGFSLSKPPPTPPRKPAGRASSKGNKKASCGKIWHLPLQSRFPGGLGEAGKDRVPDIPRHGEDAAPVAIFPPGRLRGERGCCPHPRAIRASTRVRTAGSTRATGPQPGGGPGDGGCPAGASSEPRWPLCTKDGTVPMGPGRVPPAGTHRAGGGGGGGVAGWAGRASCVPTGVECLPSHRSPRDSQSRAAHADALKTCMHPTYRCTCSPGANLHTRIYTHTSDTTYIPHPDTLLQTCMHPAHVCTPGTLTWARANVQGQGRCAHVGTRASVWQGDACAPHTQFCTSQGPRTPENHGQEHTATRSDTCRHTLQPKETPGCPRVPHVHRCTRSPTLGP